MAGEIGIVNFIPIVFIVFIIAVKIYVVRRNRKRKKLGG